MVERHALDVDVGGSIPSSPANIGVVPGAVTGPVCKTEEAGSTPAHASNSGPKCHWCRRRLTASSRQEDTSASWDHHPIPKSKGGKKRVRSCRKCNNMKDDMSAEEWVAFRREFPDWWERSPRDRRISHWQAKRHVANRRPPRPRHTLP